MSGQHDCGTAETLRHRGRQGSFGKPAPEQDSEVTIQYLDDYAESQWEVRPKMMSHGLTLR